MSGYFTAISAIIAAIAAIAAPTISACIQAKKEITLKKIEIFDSVVQSAVTDFAKSYADLERMPGYSEPYITFLSAAYNISARVESEEIRAHLSELLGALRANSGVVNAQITSIFDTLLCEISNHLRTMSKYTG